MRVNRTLARIVSSTGVAELMVENCRGRLEKPSAYRRYIERGEFLESEAAQLKSPQDKFGKRSTVDLGSSRHSLSNCESPGF